MVRSRPPSPGYVSRQPLRKRLASLAALACLVALSALAAGALFGPTFVFGSESGSGTAAGLRDAANSVKACSDDLRPSTGSLLITLPWGTGYGQVGLVQPQEGLTRGPEALAVAPDGRIAVLDSVNKRVLTLDGGGRVTGIAAVPLGEPRFLAVTTDRIYVLDCDCDHRLVTMSWNGMVYGRAVLPDLPDAVSGLFGTSAGPCIEVAHARVYRITNRLAGKMLGDLNPSDESGSLQSTDLALNAISGRPVDAGSACLVSARFTPGSDPRVTSFTRTATGVSTNSAVLDLGVPNDRGIDHLLSVDGDARQDLIVGARLLDTGDPGVPGSLLLTRFTRTANGSFAAAVLPTGAKDSLLLQDSSMAYVGQPYVVAPDGRVFQPVATEQGYAVFVHTFPGTGISARTVEVQP